uniref:Uncharacterized protein n=1 Tax=Chromera velia CCMP2878 TaxID=1169474 RepID=A0A0G4H7E6_9ALVE|eukprot:Cvel_25023.t1-p1 / transcript=Cvel_25023.t1 / gene=Cvel_25023 / organism=Chromera_velia_CCMP2878 / gene_product=hypothetical protein / transcript_product=hypothetical protein / location=Cvel_scaffold2776:20465-21088(+) / protein_length=208 / sequence_SO=supercontig / SO=protein_coding / is_pseudo=false
MGSIYLGRPEVDARGLWLLFVFLTIRYIVAEVGRVRRGKKRIGISVCSIGFEGIQRLVRIADKGVRKGVEACQKIVRSVGKALLKGVRTAACVYWWNLRIAGRGVRTVAGVWTESGGGVIGVAMMGGETDYHGDLTEQRAGILLIAMLGKVCRYMIETERVDEARDAGGRGLKKILQTAVDMLAAILEAAIVLFYAPAFIQSENNEWR